MTVHKRQFQPVSSQDELQAHLAHVAAVLRRAWGLLVQSAIAQGFVLPLRVRIVDSRWSMLRDAQIMPFSVNERRRRQLPRNGVLVNWDSGNSHMTITRLHGTWARVSQKEAQSCI